MATGTLKLNDILIIEWSSKTNKYSCSSTLECDLYFIAPKTGYYCSYTYGEASTMTVEYLVPYANKVTKKFNVPAYYGLKDSKKLIGSFAIENVPHDQITGNFTLSVYIGTGANTYYHSSSSSRESIDTSTAKYFYPADLPLETIPRNTTITVPSTAYIGDYLNISISRLSTEFTHSIKYEFGSKTGYLVNNAIFSNYTWLIPISFEDEISDTETSKVCTLTTYTYYYDGIETQTVGVETNTITLLIDPNLSGPVLEPTIVDTNNVTIALTGNSSTIVKNYSIAQCNTNATLLTASDTITNSYIKNGEKIINGTSGIIYFPTSRDFEFYVATRRGLSAKKVVKPTYVDYVTPTCRQKITTTLSGDENTQATITLLITGNFFNGSFGAVKNTLKIEVQHTQNDGSMGDWVDVTPLIPTIEGNTYSLEITITGLRHDLAYNFTSRVTDKLTTTTSEEYVAKVLPVFDWSAEDFNFNVPINMNGQTILRHNETANNLVVSSSGGHIYFRPKGTNDNSVEVKITPQGNIELVGDIIINGVSLKSKLGIT